MRDKVAGLLAKLVLQLRSSFICCKIKKLEDWLDYIQKQHTSEMELGLERVRSSGAFGYNPTISNSDYCCRYQWQRNNL